PRLAYVYSDDFLKYDFGPSHPLTPIRLKLTYELSREKGLIDDQNITVLPPRVATEEEVGLFHVEEYISLVKQMSKSGHGLLDLGDTPAFKGVYEASAMTVGATLDAVDAVMKGQADHGMNISGGLHHAHEDRASGFCVFNDPAVAIAYLKKKHHLQRIMYFDMDAHHGDGVMYGFYADPGVLDVDLHEDGRYLFPGTGFTFETGEKGSEGLKINIPMLPGTGDDPYLRAFREIVPKLVRGYKPEFIIVQCGADSHSDDMLAHLRLTTRTYEEIITTLHKLAHEVASGRIVAVGGGGYNPANVARCWTVVAASLLEVQPTDDVPDEWKNSLRRSTGSTPPKSLRSEPSKGDSPETGADQVRKNIEDLRKRIPLLGHSSS
ncbi:MAG TPA: acetoin utilization protein AcuC, partial [Candidatus Acidoferrum sp.]|nr:acetoin utilization protein AcuC [Candidatus Acidoferrum sp.]